MVVVSPEQSTSPPLPISLGMNFFTNSKMHNTFTRLASADLAENVKKNNQNSARNIAFQILLLNFNHFGPVYVSYQAMSFPQPFPNQPISSATNSEPLGNKAISLFN